MNARPVNPERLARRLSTCSGVPLADVTQDVRISVMEHTAQWDRKGLMDTVTCSFPQWLYNKVHQQLRHRYNRRARREAKTVPFSVYDRTSVPNGKEMPGAVRSRGNPESVDAISTTDFASQIEARPEPEPGLALDVRAAVKKLSPAHAELVTALFIDGESAGDYARRKGVSEAAVSLMKSRALKVLRESLSDYE